jgi:HEAT repeat protein
VERLAEAVEWSATLPADDAEARSRELSAALGHANPRIARSAARALAEERPPGGAEALRAAVGGAPADLRLRIALALWLMGDRAPAEELLRAETSDDAWLAGWGLQRSHAEDGAPEPLLYGPNPSIQTGD